MVEVDLNAYNFHQQMHVIINSLLTYYSHNKRTPSVSSQEDLEQFKVIVEEKCK